MAAWPCVGIVFAFALIVPLIETFRPPPTKWSHTPIYSSQQDGHRRRLMKQMATIDLVPKQVSDVSVIAADENTTDLQHSAGTGWAQSTARLLTTRIEPICHLSIGPFIKCHLTG